MKGNNHSDATSGPQETAGPAGFARGDAGRRIAQRREELGLSREATAVRAGTAPGYIQYLEEQPTARPGTGLLIRLADALDTTVTSLCGGDIDLPPGTGQAARRPELVELSSAECRDRLSTHGVGRLALSTSDGLLVVPVNYTVADGAVVFRTASGTTTAEAAGAQVAFEVDHIDEALGEGWSVLVRGVARVVADPVAVSELAALSHSTPWAGGEREVWMSIEPVGITGRRINAR